MKSSAFSRRFVWAVFMATIFLTLPCALAEEYVPGEVVVTLKNGSYAQDAVEDMGFTITEGVDMGDGGVVVSEVPEGMAVEDALKTLEEVPGVMSVQPNYVYELDEPMLLRANGINVDDPDGKQPNVSLARVLDAWVLSRAEGNVAVAVIDTGCRLDHEDLVNVVDHAHAWDYTNGERGIGQPLQIEGPVERAGDDQGHGTHVVGVLAAQANNGIGIAGVSYNATVVPIRVLNAEGRGSTSNVVNAIAYAISLKRNGVVPELRIINLSFGSAREDEALRLAIEEAYEEGMLCVCSAGNTAKRAYSYPSDFDPCLSVMGLNEWGKFDFYNDFNECKDIGAVGTALSTYSRTMWDYTVLSGTSEAAPVVSGIAALVWATNPDLTVDQVRDILLSTATEVEPGGPSEFDEEAAATVRAIDARAAVDLAIKEYGGVPNVTFETVEVPQGKHLTYSGFEQTGVAEHEGYTISDEGACATDVGEYVANVTPSAGWSWPDGERDTREVRWSIEPATLRCAYAGGEMYASDSEVPNELTVTGFVAEESAELLSEQRLYVAPRLDVSLLEKKDGEYVAGEYTLTPSGGNAHNYDFEYMSGTLTIHARERLAPPVATKGLTYNGKRQVGVVEGDGYTLEGVWWAIAAGDFEARATPDAHHCWPDGTYGEMRIPWSIRRSDLSKATTSTIPRQSYTGEPLTPEVEITLAGNRLVEGIDYELSFKDNRKPGTAIVTVTGKGNYKGKLTLFFTIVKLFSTLEANAVPAELDAADLIRTAQRVTALEVKGAQGVLSFEMKSGSGCLSVDSVTGAVLVARKTLPGSYFANIKVRDAGTDLYEAGSCMVKVFVSVSGSLEDGSMRGIGDQTYTGAEVCPTPKVTFGDKVLKAGKDYVLTYEDNVGPGTAIVTATGKGRFEGSLSVRFRINCRVSALDIVSPGGQRWTGRPIKAKPIVRLGERVLSESEDYELRWRNNNSVGMAVVVVSGRGFYTGSTSVTFKIIAADISVATVDAVADQAYTGKAIAPKPAVMLNGVTLVRGRDYTLVWKNNTNVGTATVTVKGKGNYKGTKSVTFRIVKKPDFAVSGVKDQTYTGSAIKPKPTVEDGSATLTLDRDYTLVWKNNTNVGTATVTVTGKGDYDGVEKSVTFKIKARAISLATANVVDQVWTGKALTPVPTLTYNGVTLVRDRDYKITWKNNTNVGTASVTVKGKGNYKGTKKATFKVLKPVSKLSISVIKDQTYTGKAIAPKPMVKDGLATLAVNRDYTLSWSNNTNVGTATVTVAGKGFYTGSVSVTFKVMARDISSAKASKIPDRAYTGSEIKPTPTLTYKSAALVRDRDYTLSWSNNTSIGTATVTVTGKGNYKGTKSVTFRIVKKRDFWSHP